MRKEIIPRLYQVTALSAHDTITTIYTDSGVAVQAVTDLWDGGGICCIRIDYADDSIDGNVNWKSSEEL